MIYLNPLDRLRFQRGCEHLHALGARATAEFLCEVGTRIGGIPAIMGLLVEYQERLSPAMLRAVGGHRFPRRPPRVVPR